MNNRTVLKISPFVLVILVGTGFLLHYKFYLYFTNNKEHLLEFVKSVHPFDDIVFIAIQIFQVLVAGALPAEITGFIGGYLYGSVLGSIYSIIGLSIGSWLAFLLARTFGLPFVRKIVMASILETYDHFMDVQGPFVAFILFLIPGFPKAALCYIIGLSQMNIWMFIVVSTIGRSFGTILLSLSGSSARNNQYVILIVIIGIIAVLFLWAYFNRDKLMKIAKHRKE